MKNDIAPSVICGLFCTPKAFSHFKNEIDGKFGMRIREFKLIDISVDLNQYNDAVNLLKSETNPILWGLLKTNFMFRDTIFNQLNKKLHLKEFDYPKELWEPNQRSNLKYAGLTPLFIDMKYKDSYDDEDKKKLDMLTRFETKNYEPKREEISPEDMKMIKNDY